MNLNLHQLFYSFLVAGSVSIALPCKADSATGKRDCLRIANSQFSLLFAEALCGEAIDETPALCAMILDKNQVGEKFNFNQSDVLAECRAKTNFESISVESAPGPAEPDPTPVPRMPTDGNGPFQIRFISGPQTLGNFAQALEGTAPIYRTGFTGVEGAYSLHKNRHSEIFVRVGGYKFFEAPHGSDLTSNTLSFVFCLDPVKRIGLRLCISEGASYFWQRVPYAERLKDSELDRLGNRKLINYVDYTIALNLGDLFRSQNLAGFAIEAMIYHRSGGAIFLGNHTPYKSTQGNGINQDIDDKPGFALHDALNAYGFGISYRMGRSAYHPRKPHEKKNPSSIN